MPKKLRERPIYLAPKISGRRDESYNPIVVDELTDRKLRPDNTNNPENIDDKIYIYERQVNEWFFKIADKLSEMRDLHSGFIILMIATSYIEGVQQYIKGERSNGRSKEFFVEAMKRIFHNIGKSDAEKFYDQVRCGLFHDGMSKECVVVSYDFPEAVRFVDDRIIEINPKLFLDKIKDDFGTYLTELNNRENTEKRSKFASMYSVLD